METTICNAKISGTSTRKDHQDTLSIFVMLDLGGGKEAAFVGENLYYSTTHRSHSKKSPAGHFIWETMKCAGVNKWEDLSGCAVRIEMIDGLVTAVGHVIENSWFKPGKDLL